jgi:hypothetical protein
MTHPSGELSALTVRKNGMNYADNLTDISKDA